jgi:hypothetical protein
LSWAAEPESFLHKLAVSIEHIPSPEPERAYDTGSVFTQVMIPIQFQLDADTFASDDLLRAAIYKRAQQQYAIYPSAGVSPAHRSAVLAMATSLQDLDQLAAAAASECRLTHLHPEAIGTAVATAIICRQLMEGLTLSQACAASLEYIPPSDAEVTRRVLQAVATTGAVASKPTHDDGFSPLVLETALHFVGNTDNFSSALEASIAFAGRANYCPVLVGSIGGALWGSSPALMGGRESSSTTAKNNASKAIGVTQCDLSHAEFAGRKSHMERVFAVTEALASRWPEWNE